MPRIKRQKYKQEKAATMHAVKKKKLLTTILPGSAITSTNKNELVIEKDQLTVKVKHQKLQNEICKLQLTSREQTNYRAKDSGNRLINWDSLNTLI